MATDEGGTIRGTYYLLDMGATQYGECVVAIFGDQRILIDAGHPGDLKGQAGYRSIPEQLEDIFGKKKVHFDLIVVTHCHDDHIGCMPELVAQGIVSAEWALVSDEGWGFGREDSDVVDAADFGVDDADPEVRGLVVALCEEDHSDLEDAALTAFIDAAAALPDRYSGMLSQMEDAGTKVIRYQRDPIPPAFTKAFQATGLEILGPEKAQLEACGKALNAFVKKATRAVKSRKGTDASLSAQDLYRELVSGSSVDATDMAGTSGPPKNNQSIVLAFGKAGERVLLAGDMQLANAEMREVKPLMEALRESIKAAGPYLFVKALHHTSYNGQDEDTYEAWGSPTYMAHSGGRNDKNHPDSGALTTLKSHSRDLQYARTDRNGIVEFSARQGFTIEKGRTNDFTTNSVRDTMGVAEPAAELPAQAREVRGATSELAASGDSILIIRLPYAATHVTVDGIKLQFAPGADTGNRGNEIGGSGEDRRSKVMTPRQSVKVRKIALGGGRDLHNLLFITDTAQLARNIGAAEAKACTDAISASANALLDLAHHDDALSIVRGALGRDPQCQGVVIVGGYDVVPALRVDVLSPEMRTKLGQDSYGDADNFIVWSDDPYGDKTGDGLPDVPVSRIPDARDAQLVFKALEASTPRNGARYGIRNTMRKFADSVWSVVPGQGDLGISEPFQTKDVKSADLGATYMYFMLHGAANDGRVFSGEKAPKKAPAAAAVHDAGSAEDAVVLVDAIQVSQLPSDMEGVVFAGCCWGALSVKDLAADSREGTPTPRVPEASIALSCLKAGSLAFVGCTGSHYSPDDSGGYAGAPLHERFWESLQAGSTPAQALFKAKVDFVAGMPHGRTDLFDLAIERKILREFTCLGLGW